MFNNYISLIRFTQAKDKKIKKAKQISQNEIDILVANPPAIILIV